MEKVLRALLTALVVGILSSACGGGSSTITPDPPTPIPTQVPTVVPSSEPTPTPIPTPLPTQGLNDVLIEGTVTFDKVPHVMTGGNAGALDYSNTQVVPARGVRVSLYDAADQRLFYTTSDDAGRYSLIAPSDTPVRVVVDAVMQRDDTYQWEFAVVDNTNSDALYSLSGNLLSSGTSNSTRNLHAPSGWSLSINDYSDISNRPAAPFAILNAIYEALALLIDAEDSFDLPRCQLNWSYRNNTVPGDNTDGEIGTTFYFPSEKAIYVLGDADVDTDEYDFSVIQHEFAHFIEDVLSRSDSWGGSHNLSSQLDMRLAFSEGLANAFTGMASGTGRYFDSGGTRQAGGYDLNLESNTIALNSRGWFNENSVGLILYDIFDSSDDGVDSLSLGFAPIYDTLTRSEFTGNSALSSIFLFADVFAANQSASDTAGLQALLQAENINSMSRLAIAESNTGGLEESLPVYSTLAAGGSVAVCTSNALGELNRLGVSRFVRFNLAAPGNRNISIQRTSSTDSTTDPDAYLYLNGEVIETFASSIPNLESASRQLASGDYVLEVLDYFNADEDSGTGGDSCFSVALD